ncbi:hypothetical protein U14_03260 [Candidatus Moduliflexus flocculans]|uniref:N-acetyltransferase domain-containing protein n=1 Tax=Candidatus Moduliflexus flocculans TaxID=1499966 RepID=A0A081BNP8_9BACT|nr:hypothetical protein U14_03260 [Candidatus Moduliflexus flocculans]
MAQETCVTTIQLLRDCFKHLEYQNLLWSSTQVLAFLVSMDIFIDTQIAAFSDIDALVELHAGFRDSLKRSTPTAEEFRRALNVLLDAPDVRMFLALVDCQPVGYAAQRYVYSTWAVGHEALLDDLYVKSEFRGHGIGRRLVEHAIRDAAAYGCRAMHLDTNEHNAASNALYARLGFTCERPRWNGGRQIRYDLKLS